jgi:hypothetical protein
MCLIYPGWYVSFFAKKPVGAVFFGGAEIKYELIPALNKRGAGEYARLRSIKHAPLDPKRGGL